MSSGWWVDVDGVVEGVSPPAPPSPFQGRRRELTALDSALNPGARVALITPKDRVGAGRTAVVWEAVRRSRRFPGGVLWWQRDSDGDTVELALGRMARQLGLEVAEGQGTAELLAQIGHAAAAHAEAAGAVLVVLDGVRASERGVLEALHRELGPVALCVTADVAGVVPDAFTTVPVGPLTVVDGLALLRRASGVSLPQNVAVSVLDVFENLPLGVLMASSRLQWMPDADPATLGDLADPGSPEARALASAPGAAAVRAWLSLYQGLSPRAQRAARWSSALGRPSVDAALLAAMLTVDVADTEEDLRAAAERGVLSAGPAIARVRPSVHGWLRLLLAASGDENEARRAHLDEVVRAVQDGSPPADGALAELVRALQTAEAQSARDALLTLVPACFGAWRGLLRAGLRESVLKAADAALRLPGARDARVVAVEAGVRSLRGTVDVPQAAEPVADADIEELRLALLEQASEFSIEAEESAVQAVVWVDGGRSDAANNDAATVRAVLSDLCLAGERAERAAMRCHAAVDEIVSGRRVALIRVAARRAEEAAAEAASAAAEAEVSWGALQQAVAQARSEQARTETLLLEAQQGLQVATRVLDDTRERVKHLHGELPDPMPAPIQEVWAGVPRALAIAMAGVRAAQANVDAVGKGSANARSARLAVQEQRGIVEVACARALEVATEAVRVARVAREQRGAVDDARQHARQAQEAAARFRTLADRVEEALDGASQPAAVLLLERARAMRGEVDRALASAVDGAARLRQTHDDGARRQVALDAGRSARIVSGHAVEMVALLTEAQSHAGDAARARAETAASAGRRNAGERLRRLEARAAEIAESSAGLPALDQTSDRRARKLIEEAHASLSAMQRSLEAARDALRDADGRAEVHGGALRLASTAEDAMLDAEQAIGRAVSGLNARAMANADKVVQAIQAQLEAATGAVIRAEHALGTVRQTLAPMDTPSSRDLIARASAAVDRARFSKGLAADGAGRVSGQTPKEELLRLQGATESAVRAANDAANDADELAERARGLVQRWLEERRQAEATARQLVARVRQAQAARGVLASTVAEARQRFSADTRVPATELALREAEGALAVSGDAVIVAAREAEGLNDRESKQFLVSLAATETAMRAFDEAAQAASDALQAAQTAYSAFVGAKARQADLRQRLSLLLDEMAPILGQAESLVVKALADLPVAPGAAATDAAARTRSAMDTAIQAATRLRELHAIVHDEARLGEIQGAHDEAEDVAEDIAGACESARAAAAEATRLAADEVVRRKAESKRVLSEAKANARRHREAAAMIAASLRPTPVPAAAAAVIDVSARARHLVAVDEAVERVDALAASIKETKDVDAVVALAAELDPVMAALQDGADAFAVEDAAVLRGVRAWDVATREEAAAGVAVLAPAELDAARWAELLGDAAVAAAWERRNEGVRSLASQAEAGVAVRGWLLQEASRLGATDPLDAVRAWHDEHSRLRDELTAADEALDLATDPLVQPLRERTLARLAEEIAAVRSRHHGIDRRLSVGSLPVLASAADARGIEPLLTRAAWVPIERALAYARAAAEVAATSADAIDVEALEHARTPHDVRSAAATCDGRVLAAHSALDAAEDAVEGIAAVCASAEAAALAQVRAAVDASATEASANRDRVRSLWADADRACLGLAEPDLDEQVAELSTQALAVEALARAADEAAGRVAESAGDGWTQLLALADLTGRSIRVGRSAEEASTTLHEALGRVLRTRHASATARASEAASAGRGHEARLAAGRGRAEAAWSAWREEQGIVALSDLLRRLGDHAADLAGQGDTLAAAARGAGLLAEAERGAARAVELAEEIALLADEVEVVATSAPAEALAAERRSVARVREAAGVTLSRVEDAEAAVASVRSRAVAAAEGWTLGEVADAMADVESLLDEMAGPSAAAAAAVGRFAEAVDVPAAQAADLALARAADDADAVVMLAEERLGAMISWQDAHVGAQLDVLAEQIERLVSDADRAVQRAVAGRLAGEQRGQGWDDGALAVAVRDLVDASIQTQRQLQLVLAAREVVQDANEFVPAHQAMIRGRAAALRTAEAAEVADAALVDVDARVEVLERREAARSAVLGLWERRLDEAQVASDEIELTLEAARSELEVETTEEVRVQWEQVQQVATQAIWCLARARAHLAAVRAATTEEDIGACGARLGADIELSAERSGEALAIVPVLLARQIRYAQGRRDLLESQMTVRVLVTRIEQMRGRVRRAVERSRDAATVSPSARASWAAVHRAAGQWEEATAGSVNLRTAVEATSVAATALQLARDVRLRHDEARALLAVLLAESARGQAAARATVGEAAHRRRAMADDANAAAVEVLQQRFDLRQRTEGHARFATAWPLVWTERPVRRAASAVHVLVARIQEADAALQREAARAVGVGDPVCADGHVELARQHLAELAALTAQAEAAMQGLADAVRAAHAARTERRDAAVAHRDQARRATQRLSDGLGVAEARRVPLFERGLAVARKRGDKLTTLGWLLDTADLYMEVGQLERSGKLLAEALPLCEGFPARAEGRVRVRSAKLARLLGQHGVAAEEAQAGIALLTDTRDPGLAEALHAEVGQALLAVGDMAGAEDALEQALEQAMIVSDARVVAVARGRLASLARVRGDAAGCLEQAIEASAGFAQVGDSGGRAAEMGRIASLLREREPVEARHLAAQAHAQAPVRPASARAVLRGVESAAWTASDRPLRALQVVAAAEGAATGDPTVQSWLGVCRAAATRGVAEGRQALTPDLAWACSKEARRRARRGQVSRWAWRIQPSEGAQNERYAALFQAAEVASAVDDPRLEGRRRLLVARAFAEGGHTEHAADAIAVALDRLVEAPEYAAAEALATELWGA